VACAQDLDVWKRHEYFAINGQRCGPDRVRRGGAVRMQTVAVGLKNQLFFTQPLKKSFANVNAYTTLAND
jgi:hypothetical protein